MKTCKVCKTVFRGATCPACGYESNFPEVTTVGGFEDKKYTERIANFDEIIKRFDGKRLDKLSLTIEFDIFEQFDWAIDQLDNLRVFLKVCKYCFWTPEIQEKK